MKVNLHLYLSSKAALHIKIIPILNDRTRILPLLCLQEIHYKQLHLFRDGVLHCQGTAEDSSWKGIVFMYWEKLLSLYFNDFFPYPCHSLFKK